MRTYKLIPVICILCICLRANTQNISISGGYFHSIILCDDGTVWHSGDNTGGQWGNNWSGGQNQTFQAVPNVGGSGQLSNIQQVDAGSGIHTLALTNDNRVITFGNNYAGQMGQSLNAGNLVYPGTPVYVENIGGGGQLSGISFVTGTSENSFAIRASDGRVISWGQNNQGQIGNGTSCACVEPLPILIPSANIVNITKVSGGDHNVMALRNDGTVWAWGANNWGMSGQNDGGTPAFHSTPVQVLQDTDDNGVPNGFLTDVVDIHSGDAFCLAKKSDGSLWAWGSNWLGQLGQGDFVDRSMAVRVHTGAQGDPSGFFQNVAQFTGGNAHSIVTTTNGDIYTFGGNDEGQLGNNTTTNTNLPIRVLTGDQADASGFLSRIVGLGRGDNWTFVMDNAGNFYAWGENDKGQLGVNNTTNQLIPRTIPFNTCTIILPVNIISFYGLFLDNKRILKWQTVWEENSSHFEIERSTNGIDFEKIGYKLSAHESYTLREYEHIDNDFIAEDKVYYRLKIIDFDNSHSYSNIVMVNNHLNSDLQIFPNPARSGEQIIIQSKEKLQEIEIIDILGISQGKFKIHNNTVDLGNLPRGNYYLKYLSGGKNINIQKLIVQ